MFSRKRGSYVENETTGERIPMIRKGGTYAMELDWVDEKENKAKSAAGRKVDMDEDGMDDEGNDEEKVVFRGQVL